MTVSDEMIERAFKRFTDCCNSMIACPRCNGTGYHHGFGENGHDPNWCDNCGGCQSVPEFDDRSSMREALTAALEAGAVVPAVPAVNYDDILSRISVFRDHQPEEDESWESWYFAAFDLLRYEVVEMQKTGSVSRQERGIPRD